MLQCLTVFLDSTLLLRLQPGEVASAAHRCSLESVGVVIILMNPSNLEYSIEGLLFSISSSVSSLQVAVERQRLGKCSGAHDLYQHAAR